MKMMISKVINDYGLNEICESEGVNILSLKVFGLSPSYEEWNDVHVQFPRSDYYRWWMVSAEVVCCDDDGYPL